jgi:hypothetical protein
MVENMDMASVGVGEGEGEEEGEAAGGYLPWRSIGFC